MQNDGTKKENLFFSEFSIPTYEGWREAAEKTLKGASFGDKLVNKTYEGITLQPMYRKEDIEGLAHTSSLPGSVPYVRGKSQLGYQEKPWEVCQELAYRTPQEWNAAALEDLQRGQTMLNLVLDSASCMGQDPDQAAQEKIGRGGVSISSLQDLYSALDGINLEQTPILIQTGTVGLPLYAMLMAHVRAREIPIKSLRGCVGMDPLGSLAKDGTLPFSVNKAYEMMASYTQMAIEQTPGLQTIMVQGTPYHDAGASAVQELAYALATGVEYIHEMQERGLTIDQITPKMLFTFSIGSNFFMEIAKLRAARLLWSQIVETFGGSQESQKLFIHARTSAWTKAVYDPYVNMLRATMEAFAAIVGGIDSLHVSPFDEAVRPPDEFSRRIARNTQIILEKEAHLSKVVDPAGGSWYVESLTDSLAKQAWKLFQEIHSQGGMLMALEGGFIQAQVSDVAFKRSVNIGRRKDKFVGTNVYPNLIESKLSEPKDENEVYQALCTNIRAYRAAGDSMEKETRLEKLRMSKGNLIDESIEAFLSGITLGEWVQNIPLTEQVAKIQEFKIQRGAHMFESLRKNAEAYKEATGDYPKVFLANMGPLIQHKARADFCTGFFQAGGFDILTNNGFDTVEKAAQEALTSGASIVVICSTDETYPDLVPPLARSIKKSGPTISLFVAGLPEPKQAAVYKDSGVDDFIHMRSNCFEVLANLQKQKGMGQ